MAQATLTAIAAIAEQRWGLVTTAQAEAAGVTRQQMSRWSRLRVRTLNREDVYPVQGLPTMTLERTIADLVEQWVDLSLMAGVVRDAVTSGRLVATDRLVDYLEPIAATQKRTGAGAEGGRSLAHHLFELAGAFPEGWPR